MKATAWVRVVRLVTEEATLFASLLKWTGLAAAVGVLAGTATALFLATLTWAAGSME